MKFRPVTPKPCGACPFRRIAMPGFLGSSSPEGFLDCINHEEPLPCHQSIDYRDPAWLAKWAAQRIGKICAGSLIFAANLSKRPRAPRHPTRPADRVAVFATATEFVRHHREAGHRTWDDAEQIPAAALLRKIITDTAAREGAPIVDLRNRSKP